MKEVRKKARQKGFPDYEESLVSDLGGIWCKGFLKKRSHLIKGTSGSEVLFVFYFEYIQRRLHESNS